MPRGGQEAGFTRSRLQEAPQGGWPQCLAGWLGHPGRVGAPPYLCAPPPPPSVSEALGHLLRPCRPHASAPGFHMAAWGCRVFSAALGLSLCCDLGSSLGSSLLLTPQPNSKSWALRTGRGGHTQLAAVALPPGTGDVEPQAVALLPPQARLGVSAVTILRCRGGW